MDLWRFALCMKFVRVRLCSSPVVVRVAVEVVEVVVVMVVVVCVCTSFC